MSNTNAAKIALIGDNSSFDKALANSAKRMSNTSKQAKTTGKDVGSLGTSFSQTANSVAIFNGQLDPISGRLSAIGTGISRFGVVSIAAAVGVTALTLGVSKLVSNLEQYELRQNKFNALLTATGYASRLTANELEKLAQTTARNTLGDVAGTSEAINALLTFRKVQGDVFKETIKLAVDAKVVFGGNLREGVVAFGKALNDPIANLGALSRKGIQFTQTQKDMISGFIENGELMKAQTIIIDEMRNQFGNVASNEAPALMASVDSLGQSWDNLLESLGNTAPLKAVRTIITGYVQATDSLLQYLAEIHSANNLEKDSIESLSQTQDKAYTAKLKAQARLVDAEKAYQALNGKANTQVQLNYSKASESVKVTEKAYEDATTSLQEFIRTRKNIFDLERINSSTGLVKTLRGEVEEISLKNKAILKQFEDRRLSLISGFEDEKDKANRVFTAKSEALQQSYDKQLTIQKNYDAKAIEALEQANKNYELKSSVRARRMRENGESEDSILAMQDASKEKQLANTLEINKIRLESEAKSASLKKTLDDTIVESELQLEIKLKQIDKLKADRIEADENRKRRALKVAASLAEKRVKLLSKIDAGDGELAKKKLAYDGDVRALQKAEFKKTEWTDLGFKTREQLVEHYAVLLAQNYDDDVEKYKKAQAAKTTLDQQRAAELAARSFVREADNATLSIENDVDPVEGFFGVNIDEINRQQEALLETKRQHLQAIDDLKISFEDKEKRRQAVNAEYNIKQGEFEKLGREKATDDMWSAMAELGASGSKKLFAINKAASIAQAGMNAHEAASNALALKLPPPVPQILAGTMYTAGLVRMNNIRKQEMPQFHDGIDYVERDGTYAIARGERVVGDRLNADLTRYLDSNKSNSGSGDMNINLSIPDTGSYNATEQWYIDNRQSIINDMRNGMARN